MKSQQVAVDTLCIVFGQTPAQILPLPPSFAFPRVRLSPSAGDGCRDHAARLFSSAVIAFLKAGTTGLPLRSKH